MALFGKTARQWKKEHPESKGNIRDEANLLELIILINLENLNAQYIMDGIPQATRLIKLHDVAVRQMKTLSENADIEKLGKKLGIGTPPLLAIDKK